MKKAKSSYLYYNNSYNKTHLFNNSFKNLLSKELNISKKIGLMEFDISSFYNKTIGEGSSLTNPKNRPMIQFKTNFKNSFIMKNRLKNNLFKKIFINNINKAKIEAKKIYLGNLYYFDYKQNTNIPIKEKKAMEYNKYWLLNSKNFTIYPPKKNKYSKKSKHYSTMSTMYRNNKIKDKNDSKLNIENNYLNKIFLTLPSENESTNLNLKKDSKKKFIYQYSYKSSPIKMNNGKLSIYLNKPNIFSINNNQNSNVFFKTQTDRNLSSASTRSQNYKTIERVRPERNRKRINISAKIIMKLLNDINDNNSNLKKEINENKLFLSKCNKFPQKLNLDNSIKPMIELNKEEYMLNKKMKEIKIKNENRKRGLISFENPKEVLNLHKKLYEERKTIKILLKNNYSLFKEYISIKRIKNKMS